MTYPYKGTNKMSIMPKEQIMLEETYANTKTGSGVQNKTLNIPPGVWSTHILVRKEGTATTGTISVRAWANEAQTVLAGGGMTLFAYGVASATSITLGAGTTAHIVLPSVRPDAAAVPIPVPTASLYGFQLRTTCNTGAGTLSYRVVAARV